MKQSYLPQRVIFLVVTLCTVSTSTAFSMMSGQDIIEKAFTMHQKYPYVYEEQTIVLADDSDNRNIRKIRRFTRAETDGTLKFLLTCDSPVEIKGVAIVAIRDSSGEYVSSIYMPTLRKQITYNANESKGGNFLGTDFSIYDLIPDVITDFRYTREQDLIMEDIPYFVIDAFPKDNAIENRTGYGRRRHFIRQDLFVISRTDFYNRHNRHIKRQTNHDFKRLSSDSWQASMILMNNYSNNHKSLIKIDRRVFSHDFVPAKIFTMGWLKNDFHTLNTEESLILNSTTSTQKPGQKNGTSIKHYDLLQEMKEH